MKIFKKLFTLIVICSLLLVSARLTQAAEFDNSSSAAQQNSQDTPLKEKLSQEIIRAIEAGSIRKGALKALHSNEIGAKFLAALDPAKIYFTKADVALIQQEYPITFNDIESGKLNNLFKIFALYQQRCLGKSTYDLKALKAGVEGLDIYRGKTATVVYADWVELPAQREERWSDLLAEDYLKATIQNKHQDKVFESVKVRYQSKAQVLSEQTSEEAYQILMNALLSLYDERTQYIGPVDNEKFSADFNLVGIGVEFNIQDGYPTVIKTIDGAPAQGKLFPKDRIIALSNDNQQFTELANLSLNKVFRLLKGERNTKVYLKVLPFSNPNVATLVVLTRKSLTLKEQEVSLKILELKRGNKNYALGVLRVPSFYFDFAAMQKGDKSYRSSSRDAWGLLSDSDAHKLDGLIIDLRDNGGGAFTEAADFFSLFQSKGVASYLKAADGKISSQITKSNLLVFTKPILVLVNRQSAGSAELLAAAVQDHQRGLVVGESTFGMGIVSSLTRVSSGSLKMSVAKLFSPKGQPINQVGVTPDIIFPAADIKSPALVQDEQAIKVDLKVKKPKYSIELLGAQHLKRIEQVPAFTYIIESKKQSQQRESHTVVLDLNQRLNAAEQQRHYLDDYAKLVSSTNEDVMQQLRTAELQETGEILADVIEQ